MEEEFTKVISEAVDTFGYYRQVLQTVEEMSELSKELMKNINRGENNESNIQEELVDTLIMLHQMFIVYNLDDEKLVSLLDKKTKKLKRHIEYEKEKYAD